MSLTPSGPPTVGMSVLANLAAYKQLSEWSVEKGIKQRRRKYIRRKISYGSPTGEAEDISAASCLSPVWQ
jgi:hypothetical protein